MIIDAGTGRILLTFKATSGLDGNPVVCGVKGKEYTTVPKG